jgi:hypothetical protein
MEEECSSLKAKLSGFEKKVEDKDAAMTGLTGDRDKVIALTGQASVAGALGTIEGLEGQGRRRGRPPCAAERARETEAAPC